MKHYEDEYCIFSMFVLWDRHKFVLIVVNWLTDDVASFQGRFLVGLSNATYLRHLRNCYTWKLKLLHLWEYLKNCHFFSESAAFPRKFLNLLLLV